MAARATTRRSSPRHPVHVVLYLLGVVATIVIITLTTYILQQYVTREELRPSIYDLTGQGDEANSKTGAGGH